MEEKRKMIIGIVLYIFTFLIYFIGMYFFTEGNILIFNILNFLQFSIYAFLISRRYKVLSPLSSITFLISSLLTTGTVLGGYTNGTFDTSAHEGISMISFSLVLAFYLVIGVIWYLNERVWKKILSIIFIAITDLFLLSYGFILPSFYQNFVYTRLFILIFFLFNVFMIVKGKVVFRILGIIGIFFSIGCLVFSAMSLYEKVYILENEDKEEVLEYIGPKSKEMIEAYNNEELSSEVFCKYCGETLISSLYGGEEELTSTRTANGKCTILGEPYVYRTQGYFYIEYSVNFENSEGLYKIVFMAGDILEDSTISGFYISEAE